jgi:hypothetical protein
MTMRQVTPAGGAASVSIAWDCGQVALYAGQVLDVPPGGPLETAIGLGNLTSLTGAALVNDQTGSNSVATGNS